MKKILAIALICMQQISIAYSQNFEEFLMSSDFAQKLDQVGKANITGRRIFSVDYPPNIFYNPPEKIISIREGMAYVFLLIYNPSLLTLDRNCPNFIHTATGLIGITYIDTKKIWFVDYIDYSTPFINPYIHRSTFKGCRIMGLQ